MCPERAAPASWSRHRGRWRPNPRLVPATSLVKTVAQESVACHTSSMAEENLDALRERIRQLDMELLERAAQRVELARQVGEMKRRQQLPTVDYAQERV